MPLPHQTVMFDVHDCAVAPLIADRRGELPVYGDYVDVPGISEVGLDPNFVTAELKGDARVIAKKGRIDRMNFSGTYSKLDLDVQKVILGTRVTDLAEVAVDTIADVDTTTASATLAGAAADFPLLLVGRGVTGPGIPEGAYIIAVNGDGSQATLSEAATATASITVTVLARVEKVRSRLMSPAPLPYFKLAFKIEDVELGLGDLHVVCYKSQVTGGSLIGSSSDNFGQPSFDAEAIALEGNLPDDAGAFDEGVIVDMDLLAELTPISHYG